MPIDDEEAFRNCAKRANADDRADGRLRLPSRCVLADLDEIREHVWQDIDAADRVLTDSDTVLNA